MEILRVELLTQNGSSERIVRYWQTFLSLVNEFVVRFVDFLFNLGPFGWLIIIFGFWLLVFSFWAREFPKWIRYAYFAVLILYFVTLPFLVMLPVFR